MAYQRKLPLEGLQVIEFAGLAPGPFVGNFGATVIRIDRLGHQLSTDVLCRHKQSISTSLKHPVGVDIVKKLIEQCDIVIDPFRPQVLELVGLGPNQFEQSNPKLIFARLTGFRRIGSFSKMAGHDIKSSTHLFFQRLQSPKPFFPFSYLALSGVLSMLGSREKPSPPLNLVADFAGGGLMCALGIMIALYERSVNGTGDGQVVETNMISGTRYLSSFPLLLARPRSNLPLFSEPRGNNILDGGAPWYSVYETKDSKFMSLGAIEPHFYAEFLRTLKPTLKGTILEPKDFPELSRQLDKSTWSNLTQFLERVFKLKTRMEWTTVFLNSDSCCVPILEPNEVDTESRSMFEDGFEGNGKDKVEFQGGLPAPAPHLSRTPARSPPSCDNENRQDTLLVPGQHTIQVLINAGYTTTQIRQLIRDKVVQCTDNDLIAKL